MNKQIDREEFGINPFFFNFKIPATRLEKRGSYKVVNDPEVGEIKVPSTFLIESRKFVRLYHSAKARKLTMSLSPYSNHLLTYIKYKTPIGSDVIKIDKESFLNESGIGLSSYKKSLKELKDKGFIASTSKRGYYYINVQIFFNGNPINSFSDDVEIKYDMTE